MARNSNVNSSQVMWSPSHILHQRFQPSSKTQEGLHATHISLSVVSGQYVCKENYGASPLVEIEVMCVEQVISNMKPQIVYPKASVARLGWYKKLTFAKV